MVFASKRAREPCDTSQSTKLKVDQCNSSQSHIWEQQLHEMDTNMVQLVNCYHSQQDQHQPLPTRADLALQQGTGRPAVDVQQQLDQQKGLLGGAVAGMQE